MVTAELSGSVTPIMLTATIVWFGGQSTDTLGLAKVHTGGSFTFTT